MKVDIRDVQATLLEYLADPLVERILDDLEADALLRAMRERDEEDEPMEDPCCALHAAVDLSENMTSQECAAMAVLMAEKTVEYSGKPVASVMDWINKCVRIKYC